MKNIILLLISFLMITSCITQKEYFESGKLKAKGKVANELKNGKWKLFYEGGNLYQVGNYFNGKETGEWKIFHENGKIRQIGKFNNGKQTGEWNFYHANGNREGIGTLIDGEKTGIWKWYFENGKIFTERNWREGKLVEIISCTDSNGKDLDKGTFKNGNGTLKIYNSKGILIETSYFENGEYKN